MSILSKKLLSGNLGQESQNMIDKVLPSQEIWVTSSGVFWLDSCNVLVPFLGLSIIGGCGAMLLCYRWKRQIEKSFTDLNSAIEEMSDSLGYIRHRLTTRDCCSCDVETNADNISLDDHHCDKKRFLALIDTMLDSDHLEVEQAYYMLKSRLSESRNDSEFLVRVARAAHSLGQKHRKKRSPVCAAKRNTYLSEAHQVASLALKLNRNSADTNKWYAITLESFSKTMSTLQRIRTWPKIERHIECALVLCDNDPLLYNVLGKFCLELATMSFLERSLARFLFGFDKDITVQCSRQHLMHSHSLDPSSKSNHLYIAQSYASERRWSEAIDWVERGLVIPSRTNDDNDELIEFLDYLKGNGGSCDKHVTDSRS